MSAIEKEFEKWLEGAGSSGDVIWVGEDVPNHKVTFLLGDNEFSVAYPAKYPAKADKFTVESRARSLSEWAQEVTKKLHKAKPKTIADVLTFALGISRKPTKKSSRQEEPPPMDDDAGDGSFGDADDGDGDAYAEPMETDDVTGADFDLEGKGFQEGLEVLRLKKRWAAKEAELRDAAAKEQQQGRGMERGKVAQIFSSSAATGVLTNDLLLIRGEAEKLGFTAEPIDDSIYDWKVKMGGFRPDTQMAKDLLAIKEQYGYDQVEFRVQFVLDLYPFFPPLVRVVRPRFVGFMMGRITSMETLKLSGWDPVKDMRGVLCTIRSLLEDHGRLDVNNPMNSNPDGAYTELEFLLLRLELLCETPARVHAKYPELSSAPKPKQSGSPGQQQQQQQQQTGANHDKSKWAKGTGYGSGSTSGSGKSWDVNAYLAAQQQKDLETASVLRAIAAELRKAQSSGSGVAYDVLEESCIVPVLESYIRNDSFLDMVQHISLYLAVFEVCEALASTEEWLPLFEQLPNQARSVIELLRTQSVQAKILLTSSGAVGAADAQQQEPIKLATAILSTFNVLERNIEKVSASIRELESSRSPQHEKPPATATASAETPDQIYMSRMKELQYDMGKMDIGSHHYASMKSSSGSAKAKVLRLAQEQASIAVSLPLTCDSSVFIRVCEDRIDYMRALITGPSAADYGSTSTPYAGGCFQFDIHFPANYPNSPPLVNLMTTGHGTVRFNPNLYNCGKVCLSLLGTWSGAEGETWNPKTSTLLQVLVSIQSLIMVPQPFFNEPGYEQQMGTVHGDRASQQYNEVIRAATIEHAIIGQLRSPSPGFEEVIRRHFYLQQDRIVAQANRWADEAQASSKAHYNKLLKLIRDMKAEFASLSFPFPKLAV